MFTNAALLAPVFYRPSTAPARVDMLPQRQFILFLERLQLSHGILVDFYHPIRENKRYNEKQRRHGKKS